jgi:hypothetical protein
MRAKTPTPAATVSAPVTVSSTPVIHSPPATKPKSSTVPGGFLQDEDDDEMQPWDDNEDNDHPEDFFDAPSRPPVRVTDAVPGGKVSSFGPKPFTLHPKKPAAKKELDFESMAGTARKPVAPIRNKSAPVATRKTVPAVKKTQPAKKTEVKKDEGWGLAEDEDEDWGEGWGG